MKKYKVDWLGLFIFLTYWLVVACVFEGLVIHRKNVVIAQLNAQVAEVKEALQTPPFNKATWQDDFVGPVQPSLIAFYVTPRGKWNGKYSLSR